MKKITYLVLLIALMLSMDINAQNEIQRVRIDFETPLGYTRQLLLGFTPNNAATDGFDYGYDALCIDSFPDDFNYMIGENRYVIQGVGSFDITKTYPIGVFLSNSGTIRAALNSTENFNEPIEVYIYDSLLNSYYLINETTFEEEMSSGNYLNRFYVAFQDANQFGELQLSVNDNQTSKFDLKFSDHTHELVLKSRDDSAIESVEIFNSIGQKISSITNNQDSTLIAVIPQSHQGVSILKIVSSNQVKFLKVIL